MKTLTEFIDNLTGKEGLSLSQLSSAQKARAIAWAREADVEIDDGLVSFGRNENISDNGINVSKSASAEVKTGIDIQSIKEFFPVQINDLKSDRSLLNIFTMSEIAYAESKLNPLSHLTGIFALKEAIMKASNTMLADISALEIAHDSFGVPNYGDFTLSLSYTGDLVVAIAVSVSKEGDSTRNAKEIKARLLDLESSPGFLPQKRRNIHFFLKIVIASALVMFGCYLYKCVGLESI